MKIFRHGDILLKQIEKLPEGRKEIKDKTLAYGEVTGHSHRFMNPDDIRRYKAKEKVYLEALLQGTLIHEEHKPLIIDPGIYEQIKEREYDYISEEEQKVVD